jgi:hypothetical protein
MVVRVYPLGLQPDLDLAERTLYSEVSLRLVEGTEMGAQEEMVGRVVAPGTSTPSVQGQLVREITAHLVRSVLSQVKMHMAAAAAAVQEQLGQLQHQ